MKNPLSLFVLPPLQNIFTFTRQWQNDKTCNACQIHHKQLGRHLLLCSRCKRAQYCSQECQKAHWKEHKKVCHALADGPMGTVVFQSHNLNSTGENGISIADMCMESPAAIEFVSKLYRPRDQPRFLSVNAMSFACPA